MASKHRQPENYYIQPFQAAYLCSSPESNTMIQIRNIHKTFGNNTILRGVDLDIAKGQVVVILGPSGSGKTTFLRCLNALEVPETSNAKHPPILHKHPISLYKTTY